MTQHYCALYFTQAMKNAQPPEAPTPNHTPDILISTLHINKATKFYL